jgi:WD40 repeat protein
MKKTVLLLLGFTLLSLAGWGVTAPAPLGGRPKEVACFKAHRFSVENLTFSPDGKTLASAGRGGTIKLWDVASASSILEIKSHTPIPNKGVRGMVYGVAFSPDGKTLVSCGDDRKVHLWDARTGRHKATLSNCHGTRIVFSPDGQTVVVEEQVWELATGKERRPVKAINRGISRTVAFDPKGRPLIATAGDWPHPPVIWLWDLTTGEKRLTLKGHTKPALSMAFSPDAKVLASSGYDFTVRLWDVATGKNTLTIKDHPGQVYFLLFSPDGKTLAAGYRHQRDGVPPIRTLRFSVRLYETATLKLLATLDGTPGPVGPLAFSPDGRMLATGTRGPTITLWKLPVRYAAGK